MQGRYSVQEMLYFSAVLTTFVINFHVRWLDLFSPSCDEVVLVIQPRIQHIIHSIIENKLLGEFTRLGGEGVAG